MSIDARTPSLSLPAPAPDRLTAPDGATTPAAERAKLAELAAQFESMLMLEMIKQMRKSLLDEQADQIFAMTDMIAERARKIGGTTIRSISDIASKQRLLDNNADYVDPQDMLAELHGDNKQLVAELRRVHELCDEYSDVATASLIEVWIDETERRAWFLYESCRTPKLI